MEQLWKKYPEKYVSIYESRKEYLLPEIIKLIKNYKCSNILDFGCGDGALFEKIDSGLKLALYDNSKKVLKLAKNKLGKIHPVIYYKLKDIPKNYFDCIVVSLVLITIDSIKEQKRVLKNICRFKTKEGIVIIAITHPCFRHQHFSTFFTEYSNKNKYPYFNEGRKFKVTLIDRLSDKSINFHDFHWSLSKTINLLIENNLNINKLIEIRDRPVKGSNYNRYFPSYMIIICK